jgi:hypothetical protein
MNAISGVPVTSASLDPRHHREGPPVAELARLDALIERAVRRLRARYELSLDEFRGLYISDTHVDALLAARETASDVDAPPVRDPLDPPQGLDDGSAWSALARTLELERAEADVLLLALAPELDPRYGPLLAYLNDDASRRWATPELAERLFRPPGSASVAWRQSAGPAGRLFGLGLLQWHPGAGETVGRAQRGLRVVPALADWLAGLPYADERLAGIAHWHLDGADRGAAHHATALDAGTPAVRWARMLRAEADWPIVNLSATHLSEAVTLARSLLQHAGRTTLQLDPGSWRGATPPHEVAEAALLAQRVFGAGLLLVSPSITLSAAGGDAGAAALTRLTLQGSAVVLADTDPRTARRLFGDAPPKELLELRADEPSLGERVQAWRSALNADGLPHEQVQAREIDTALLADRFALGPARIAQALGLARRSALIAGETRLDTRRLLDAARSVCAAAGGEMTRAVHTTFEWDDLVLPAPVRERLTDLLRAVELRARVLDEWGFQRRLGQAGGVKAMFAGPSGTGKSMAASLIAKALSLDLHRVELAATVSKYIGETEKNLDRAFDTARAANAILFIDEADALFGKRSEVKDAHDRYANVETAYLLQKMEDHDGVVILATNLANNIDNAFSRRMHFIVEFPLPDVPRRELLWRGMFPREAPLGADVDFSFLARQFPFAGGDIRNIVLDAAYAAAQQGEPIGMATLLRAVSRQFAKRGQVASASEFREYHGLLQQGQAGAPATHTGSRSWK